MLESKLISIREAAKVLGVSRSTLYLMLDDNRLASVKLNRRRLVTVESINCWLAVEVTR